MEEDDDGLVIRRLKEEVAQLSESLNALSRESAGRAAAVRAAMREVELLRQENAMLRGRLEEDQAAARNWRCFVAKTGAKHSALYVVPPPEDEEH